MKEHSFSRLVRDYQLKSLLLLPVVLLIFFSGTVHVSGQEASENVMSVGPKDAMLLKANNVSFELVRIPTGEFVMGSGNGDSDEKPVHPVRIGESFYMGRTEVTVRQFKAFVEATGYKTEAEKGNWASKYSPAGFPIVPGRGYNWKTPGFPQTQDDPVVCISFDDAIAFCKWLSRETGQNCLLPSEAQWEYACRAGNDTDLIENIGEFGWYRGNSAGRTHPVGQKKPNAFGLYDMHGNVWEWCLDLWHSNYNGAPADGSPWLTEDYLPLIAVRRVLRGGAWCRRYFKLGCTFRYRGTPDFKSDDTGFRIVCLQTALSEAPQTGKPVYRRPDKENPPAGNDGSDSDLAFSVDGEKFELVRISPGRFMMGSARDSGEQPIHPVQIDYSFDIGRTEVTVRQFRAFIEATDYQTDAEKERWAWTRSGENDWDPDALICWQYLPFKQTDNDPATCISWFDAMEFCRWLSGRTGMNIRLPSEAEWEYACRAGTDGDFAGDVDQMAWHRANSRHRTHPVAQKKPNAWGLYDMHGNVWEWCLDMWHSGYDGAPADGSPWMEVRVFEPVMRGGTFINPKWWLRSANHMRNNPGNRFSYNQGIRIVRSR